MHPWPADPECILTLPDDPDGIGWLTYLEPGAGNRTSLPVTLGPTRGPTEAFPYPVWHLEILENGRAITEPSILVRTTRPDASGAMVEVDLYHSPYRVEWAVVEEFTSGG